LFLCSVRGRLQAWALSKRALARPVGMGIEQEGTCLSRENVVKCFSCCKCCLDYP